jgi:predicted DNA-binding transcriptional regulator YafY
MQRVLIGDAAPDSAGTIAKVDKALVATFEQAFTAGRLLAFSYVDRKGRRTRRHVEPHGLLVRAPLWYVIAWDSKRDAARLFRADRIRRPTVSGQSFLPRPHDLVTRVCPDAVDLLARQ